MKATLDTVILFVNQIELIKQFYHNLLQLTITEEIAGQWVVLDAGGCSIGLHKIPEEYAVENIDNSENNVKLVFTVDADIYVLREELFSKSIRIGEVKTWDNYPFLLCEGKDPEGNTFQLQQKK